MSRITPYKLLIMNLEEKIEEGRREHMSKEEAYKTLKQLTGQDFGMDVEKWKEWLKANHKH